MYVRIIKESKAKASICFIGTSGKIYIFWWIRVLRGACNILPLLIWIRRISEWVGQSMGNTQAMDFILRTGLFDYY